MSVAAHSDECAVRASGNGRSIHLEFRRRDHTFTVFAVTVMLIRMKGTNAVFKQLDEMTRRREYQARE